MPDAKRILLVDDEETVTRTLALFLEAEGRYQVQTVNDPRKAREIALSFRPDLMILDVIMPHMDGGDLAAQLTAVPALEGVPVIFMTALVKEAEIGAQGGAIGGRPFLAKPVESADLLAVIESTLGGEETPH